MKRAVALLVALVPFAVGPQVSFAREKSPPPPTGVSLVVCQLGKINFETLKPEGPNHPLTLLLGVPRGAGHLIGGPDQLQVIDSDNILADLPLESASYGGKPTMLVVQTDSSRPVYFRLAVSLEKSTGALGLNGDGTAEEHMAQSYMGPCTVSEPPDAAAQFEALRAVQ